MDKDQPKRRKLTPLEFIMSIKVSPNKEKHRSATYQYGYFKGKGTGCW